MSLFDLYYVVILILSLGVPILIGIITMCCCSSTEVSEISEFSIDWVPLKVE